jgi:hypothetical protein
MAFFDDQPLLQDSDEDRVGFANYYLEGLRFLYKDSENDDKKVSDFEYDSIRLTIMILFRNGRGSFAVPLSSRPLLPILVLSRVP